MHSTSSTAGQRLNCIDMRMRHCWMKEKMALKQSELKGIDLRGETVVRWPVLGFIFVGYGREWSDVCTRLRSSLAGTPR